MIYCGKNDCYNRGLENDVNEINKGRSKKISVYL